MRRANVLQVDKTVPREGLLRAMAVYSPTEKASSCRNILEATHALFAASLLLCETPSREMEGVIWTCFIIENTPMVRTLVISELIYRNYGSTFESGTPRHAMLAPYLEFFKPISPSVTALHNELFAALCRS